MSARERLIASTVALIRSGGVSGASVSEVLEHSGLARRTLYLNFPGGKSELVTIATELAGAAITASIEESLDQPDPGRVVEAFVAMWANALGDSDYTAGCPVVAATLSRAEVPAAADAAAAAFMRWEDLLASHLRNAGLAADTAADLATTVVASVEGAVIMSLAQRSPVPLQRTGRQIVALIDARIGQPANSARADRS